MNITTKAITSTNVYPNSFLLIILIIIISIVLLFMGISGWLIKKRVYYASIFGKIEHKSGRLIGITLIITFFVEFYLPIYTIYFIIISFAVWIIYLLSHTIEKMLYGNYGPRR